MNVGVGAKEWQLNGRMTMQCSSLAQGLQMALSMQQYHMDISWMVGSAEAHCKKAGCAVGPVGAAYPDCLPTCPSQDGPKDKVGIIRLD